MNTPQSVITVTRMEIVNQPFIKAFVSIGIGFMEVHGVRIVKSKKNETQLMVYMPKEKKGEDYVPVVEIHNKQAMGIISEVVLADYHAKVGPQKQTPSVEQTLSFLGGAPIEVPAVHKKPYKRQRYTRRAPKTGFMDLSLPDDDLRFI